MLENRSGRIILIGSVQEKKPHPEMAVYSALKSAMSNLVAGLSVKFAPYGVTVNNICISSSRSTVIGTRCQILSFHVISKTFWQTSMNFWSVGAV